MSKAKKGLVRVRGGKIQTPGFIDIQELNGLPRPKLEQQCIYLMKKRDALEQSIQTYEGKIKNLHVVIRNRERQIDRLNKQVELDRKTHEQILTMSSKEKNDLHDELIRVKSELKKYEC